MLLLLLINLFYYAAILSKTIRYLELSLPKIPQDPILIAELILRPENGIILNIKKRKY